MTRLEAGTPDGDRWSTSHSGRDTTDYVNGLRRRWRLVLAVVVLAVAAAIALSLSAPSRYDATAKLVFGSGTPVEAFGEPSSAASSEDPERILKTNAELITDENIAERVIDRLGLDRSADDLLDDVETDTEADSDIVALTVRDGSPEHAAEIANAFAQEYVEFRREAARRNLEEAAELARARLESLTALERESEAGRELQSRLRELEIAAALQTGGVELVRPASVPEDRASPKPVITAIIALILGLVLGCALAVAAEAVDRRLKDEDEIERLFGLPLLAAIPRPGGRGARRSRPGNPQQGEGYATLATNLRFFKLGPEISSLVITSPGASEGKTSVTLGLARALTGLGQRVVAIEADLRQPTFAAHVALPRRTGLSSVLAGASTFAEALVELDGATDRPVEELEVGSGRSYWVLPSGPVPPNPQALLGTPAMRDVLREAAALADVILVDTPPIAVVNDAATLVDLVDGAIVVARLNGTTRDSARRALRILENLRAPTLGLVMTNVRRSGDAYYGYEDPGRRIAAGISARS